jgi:hypothetical protein
MRNISAIKEDMPMWTGLRNLTDKCHVLRSHPMNALYVKTHSRLHSKSFRAVISSIGNALSDGLFSEWYVPYVAQELMNNRLNNTFEDSVFKQLLTVILISV